MIKGKLEYLGPDDPPAHYYRFTTVDGRVVYIGFKAEEWGGDLHRGVPGLPIDPMNFNLSLEPA